MPSDLPMLGAFEVALDDILTRVFTACAADAKCTSTYPDLEGSLTQLQAKLLYGAVRIGSWAAEKQFFAFDVASMMPDAYRLPGQLSPKELEVRARYTIVASQLLATPNDFDEIRATVDRHLR